MFGLCIIRKCMGFRITNNLKVPNINPSWVDLNLRTLWVDGGNFLPPKDLMIYKCYGLETWHDCSWRQMMTSYQKLRHHLIWSWNYTPKHEIFKNADQAFLAGVLSLILQKSCFCFSFDIILKLEPKKLSCNDFLLRITLAYKRQKYYYHF